MSSNQIEDMEEVVDEDKQELRVQVAQPQILEAPSVASLVNPVHAGYLEKQGYVMGCMAAWKRRFFVLKAGYLFKFDSDKASRPKGAPIPLSDAEFSVAPFDKRPFGFKVSTIRKEYCLSAANYHDMTQWLNLLGQQKLIAIKQAMGHIPISQDDTFANAAGDFLCKKKLTEVPTEKLLESENPTV